MTGPDLDAQRARGVRRTLYATVGTVVFMAGMGFAAVPLYDWFCRVTGYGGTTNVAAAAPERILDQTIRVRFDASLAEGMPWQFRPVERVMDVRYGEMGLAFYEAHNPTDRPVAGTATYNVTPFAAGLYFTKIDCFCFQMQVLQPGETVLMPVTFFVHPDMVDDPEARSIRQITLSYTFHTTPIPEDLAALPAEPEGDRRVQ
jgi:cytochrome c oxidase assembly protein subunit 11